MELKKIHAKTFILSVFFVALFSLTIQTNFNFPLTSQIFNVSVSEAKASTVYDDAELADATCWVTGETFLKCVHGSYVCDAADQGTCSNTEPEVD